jgi:K+-dependent Na+/Ca+ exchanger-like protein
MAMGSSAPELAIALIALFAVGGTYSDVGTGTIVGSAVFNILVITGVSALVRPARVTWQVVMRDCMIYTASIILLLLVSYDGVINGLEAAAFVGLYAVYIYILFQWNKVVPNNDAEIDLAAELAVPASGWGQLPLYQKANYLVVRGLGLLAGDPHRAYLRAFLVSIVVIVVVSWVLVEYSIIFAHAVGIPPVIVALTVLAAGTSAPDMIASMIVARQGRGEMAIANAVGSNIFNILIGLGLPWLIVILVFRQDVYVATDDLWLSIMVLLGTVILLFVFLSTERLLSRIEGWALIVTYTLFVLWTWLESTIMGWFGA